MTSELQSRNVRFAAPNGAMRAEPIKNDAQRSRPELPSPGVPGPEITGSPLDAEQKSFDATADALLNKGGLAFDFDRYEVTAGTKRGDDLEGSAAWDNMFGRAGSDALPDAKALCAGRLFDPLLESSRRAFWED